MLNLSHVPLVENGNDMKSPLFDGNTIVAIESVFTNKVNDPFWKPLLRDFTNLFVYSETARFPMPLKDPTYSEKDYHILPVLLKRLIKENRDFFNPVTYPTIDLETVKEEFLFSCFNDFRSYLDVSLNIVKLHEWLLTHNSEYIVGLIKKQASGEGYTTYNVNALKSNVNFAALIDELNNRISNKYRSTNKHPIDDKYSFADENGITENGLLYAFDNVLRYQKYGEFVGENEFYLSHPLRSEVNMKTIAKVTPSEKQLVPIYSFGDKVAEMAKYMSLDDYIAMLLLLKEEVWKNDLHKISNRKEIENEVFQNVIQEISLKAGFPAHLKPVIKKIINISGVTISTAGSLIPSIGPIIALGGVLVVVVNNVWERKLTNIATGNKWLKWAVTYDV